MMLKMHDTEKFNLTPHEKSMAQSIVGHLHYYLDNGFSEGQIVTVLKRIVKEMEK